MTLSYTSQDIEHISRHLFSSPVCGGKFNAKIVDPKKLLQSLSPWLSSRIDFGNIEWMHNDVDDIDKAVLAFCADEDLKKTLVLSSDEPLGYKGLVEITDELRPYIVRENRGIEGLDRVVVNIVETKALDPTDEIVIHLRKSSKQEGIYITTAYPGFVTQFLFPNRLNQAQEEYEKSQAYWNTLTFLKHKAD